MPRDVSFSAFLFGYSSCHSDVQFFDTPIWISASGFDSQLKQDQRHVFFCTSTELWQSFNSDHFKNRFWTVLVNGIESSSSAVGEKLSARETDYWFLSIRLFAGQRKRQREKFWRRSVSVQMEALRTSLRCSARHVPCQLHQVSLVARIQSFHCSGVSSDNQHACSA